MKNATRHILLLLGLVIVSTSLGACDKENGERYTDKVRLNEYILGSWHSYRATVYGNGIEKTVDITNNNEYSAAYIEMTFKENGIVSTSVWQANPDGSTKWISGEDAYLINGKAVEIREIENKAENGWNDGLSFETPAGSSTFTRAGYDDEVMTMIFEPSNRTLFLRLTQTVNGINVVMNIYFKKMSL